MANQTLSKNYLIASVIIHLLVVFGISYMIKRDALSGKSFVVFGAHSRYTTKALYKSSVVPFTGTPGKKNTGKKGKSGKGQKKAQGKKVSQDKKAAKKQVAKKLVPAVKPKVSSAKQKEAPTTPKAIQKSMKVAVAAVAIPAPTAIVKEKKQVLRSKKKLQKKEKVKAVQPPPPPPIEEIIQEEPKPIEKAVEQKEAAPVAQEAEVLASELLTPALEEQLEEATLPEDEALIISAGGDDSDEDDDEMHTGVVDALDPATRYHQRVVSREISRIWKPPLGVPKGTECTARITFGPPNGISKIEFITRSKVPIYDLSILRSKLEKSEVPPELYGKHQIITFRQ